MEAVNITDNSVALLVMLCVLLSVLFERRRYPQGRSFYLPSLIADVAMLVCRLLADITSALGSRGMYLVLISLSDVCLYAVQGLFVFGFTNFISQRAAIEVRFLRLSTVLLCTLSVLGCVAVNAADLQQLGAIPLRAAQVIAQIGDLWVIGVTLYIALRYRRRLERGVARSFTSLLLLPLLGAPLWRLLPGFTRCRCCSRLRFCCFITTFCCSNPICSGERRCA